MSFLGELSAQARIGGGELYRRVLSATPPQVLAALPGSSERWGPPRRTQALAEYAVENQLERRVVNPARAGRLAEPFFPLSSAALYFRDGAAYAWPESGTTRLREVKVAGPFGWVMGPRDTLLYQNSFHGGPQRQLATFAMSGRSADKLSGRTLNLWSNYAGWNYCHCLLDALGRWALVRAAGFTWDDFDHVLAPTFQSPAVEEIKAKMGLPLEKCVALARPDRVWCEELIQPDYPGSYECYAPWVVEFYRELFPVAAPVRQTRRLYIPRRGGRRPLNEKELDTLMREEGFEIFDPMAYGSVAAMREVLAAASHVVAIHGAANTNLVFCQRGTRILEVVPTDQRWRFFYSLASAGGMPYGVVSARSERERPDDRGVPSTANFTVDLEQLRAGISALLGKPHEPA